MRARGLSPFTVSERVGQEMIRRNVFAVRYAVTHDIFHLLLGFDTTLSGEMGVLAFAVAQGYSRAQVVSLVLAAVLYPILAPRQARRTLRALARGYRLGKQARCLLAERFEERWEEPIDAVRRDLGLPQPEVDHAKADLLQPA
jgi:ubiquinone biosynthesis protein Coq4